MSILSLLCCLLLSLTGLVSADGGGYDDWSWATSIAAVGDSFTAGIGAGRLWNSDSAECARYDQSYPAVILRWLGGSRAFQFPACSGDTSISILNQIDSLLGGVNLAFMSAGGNDLCLVCWTSHFLPELYIKETNSSTVKHHCPMRAEQVRL
jgi:lysophospholipase L1-like esterase